MCIVLQLPPRGGTIHERQALSDRGDRPEAIHGLLASPTTHIPGPRLDRRHRADRARQRTRRRPLVETRSSRRGSGTLAPLDQQIQANNRLKFAALFILAGVLLAPRAARPARGGDRRAGGAARQPRPRDRDRSRMRCFSSPRSRPGRRSSRSRSRASAGARRRCSCSTAAWSSLYAVVMVTRPEWQAINPFGPTQNSRFWGIGNQVETLLLAPLLAGPCSRDAVSGFSASPCSASSACSS